jgi:hypothetical protein
MLVVSDVRLSSSSRIMPCLVHCPNGYDGPSIEIMGELFCHFTELYIYLFIYLHSTDPYIACAPVDIEIVVDKRANHHLDGQIGQTQYTELHTLV